MLAVRDNGDTRDLLLIGADRSVGVVYSVPEPNTYDIGYAGVDDRWIVIALDRIPRNSNGVLPTVKRIEIMYRADGSIRTIDTAPDDAGSIDSVALFQGRVYWRTKDSFAADIGTVRSFDPDTGAVAEVDTAPTPRPTDGTASGLDHRCGPGRDGYRLLVARHR